MRWAFTLPGQPLSWNVAYRIGWKTTDGRKHLAMFKTSEATRFQSDARLIISAAKPSKWKPAEQVRIYYRFYLKRDVDCDNVMKLLNDTIEKATGVDDKRYLPCVISKEIVRKPQDARVEVVIEDRRSPSVGLPTWSTTRTG